MAFKMKSGMKPSFRSMGSSPVKQAKPKGGKYQIKSDDKGDYIDTEFGKARSPEYGLYDLPGGVDREGRLMGDDIRFKVHKDHGLVVDHMYEESKTNPDHHAQQAEMEKKRSKSPAKQKGSKKVDFTSPALNEVSGFPEMDVKTTNKAPKKKAPKNLKSPAKSRADRKAGRAAKAAQKHAQAEDRGKSRKADRQAVKVAKHGGHAEAAGTSSGTPMFQTSHGPIREFNPPRNPNEGPYIVRSRSTGQTVEPNNDGPDYRHIRERTGLDDGPHPERPQSIGPSPHQTEILGGRPKQLRNYDSFVKGAKEAMKNNSPAKKRGLWDNIHAKRRRGEKMREKGDKGAPTEKAMRDSQSPAKQRIDITKAVMPKAEQKVIREQIPTMVVKELPTATRHEPDHKIQNIQMPTMIKKEAPRKVLRTYQPPKKI